MLNFTMRTEIKKGKGLVRVRVTLYIIALPYKAIHCIVCIKLYFPLHCITLQLFLTFCE